MIMRNEFSDGNAIFAKLILNVMTAFEYGIWKNLLAHDWEKGSLREKSPFSVRDYR